ncbi:MAG: hypothetical protein HKN36_12510 [Hellea sp.]|nr:hypothetical protein [Hellea sp.]
MTRFLNRFLWPLLGAIFVTYILACIFQTQRVISLLQDSGGDVSFGERLSMTFYDLRHLSMLYLPFISIALTAAMAVSIFLAKKFKGLEIFVYIVAGMTAMMVLLFGMKMFFFDVHLIAGARDGFGLTLQAIAGGFGGKMFYRLRK